ncbi:hypothetical protein [Sphingomicrobium clamense]|uniref:EF-hand domain-containing protein n=1 Tax=Sphingomicrobium clamense TaxID=2851013 RepID=A0ABS6V6F6_9SPHN|nr:hypothetical protein [Sphingomicrobium sp. B8]MBW0145104.1 hypothetical protein [Sphingomicrobium sp. B8]
MRRLVAGIAAGLFLTSAAVLLARDGEAEGEAALPEAAMADAAETQKVRELPVIPELGPPPKADPVSKEEKRFNRVDKDGDELITLSEIVQPRRKRFANLDLDGDGMLRFEEWAISTIDKFEGADADGNGTLTRAEYATTAPKPRKPKPKCSC